VDVDDLVVIETGIEEKGQGKSHNNKPSHKKDRLGKSSHNKSAGKDSERRHLLKPLLMPWRVVSKASSGPQRPRGSALSDSGVLGPRRARSASCRRHQSANSAAAVLVHRSHSASQPRHNPRQWRQQADGQFVYSVPHNSHKLWQQQHHVSTAQHRSVTHDSSFF
jgi:hypothetical protein